MKHSQSKAGRLRAALLLVMALTGLVSACGATAGTQVAGADQQVIYGYVLEVNDQARTITVDPVELVAGADTQRRSQLGLGAALSGDRSYAHNARRNFVMYALDRTAEFDFSDSAAGEANQAGNGPSGDTGSSGEGGLPGGRGDTNVGNGGSAGATGSGAMGAGGGDAGAGLNDNGLTGGNGSERGGAGDGSNASGSGGAAANNANSAANNTNASQGGNSVSGNTTVGNGTASDSDSDSSRMDGGPYAGDGSSANESGGYGYTGVQGGLFASFSSDYDRLNAYIDRYGDLLCRLVLENGAVTKVTVCTEDNM